MPIPPDFVICRSDFGDGGWSLHAPGSSDEDIAEGRALPLITGTGPITDRDRARAVRVWRAMVQSAPLS